MLLMLVLVLRDGPLFQASDGGLRPKTPAAELCSGRFSGWLGQPSSPTDRSRSGSSRDAAVGRQGIEEDVEPALLQREGDADAGVEVLLSHRLDREDVVVRLAGLRIRCNADP